MILGKIDITEDVTDVVEICPPGAIILMLLQSSSHYTISHQSLMRWNMKTCTQEYYSYRYPMMIKLLLSFLTQHYEYLLILLSAIILIQNNNHEGKGKIPPTEHTVEQ